MEYRLLSKINSPKDVKKLELSEIDELCAEIRDVIMNTVSKNGGHLASNLGSVELTVAIHRAFNAPEDAVIFDVGHQCYTHKLLTGRFNQFDTIRQKDGISGFMRPFESEYDPFVTGHSSNSVSAAYGIYKSKCIKGESGTAVAVIGDGAITGGLAFEGLNNAASGRSNFIVILNDNKMSISRNVGAIARTLTKMRNKPRYHHFKFAVDRFLNKIPLIGKPVDRFVFKVKEFLKSIVYRNNIFKSLGFNYFGPVDGHDVKTMEELFSIVQNYNRPSLIHVVTVKGKGYEYAENSPKNYHGVSPFDIDKGAKNNNGNSFSSVVGKTLCKLAEKDEKVCAITAAMSSGTGLNEFSSEYKNRFFDVGIAEQHALTFSSGLASGGLKPYFAVYSSFLQRAYDQIVHDTAIANVPLKILVDRAGFVGQDGESHQGLFDVSFLSGIPNMNIYSPTTFKELEYRISDSVINNELCAIRYPKGAQKTEYDLDFKDDYTKILNSSKKCVVTYGRLFDNVFDASKSTVFDILKLNKIYPLNKNISNELLSYDEIYFYEEGIKSGGIAEHLGTYLLQNGFKGKYTVKAVENEFVSAMTVNEAFKNYQFDVDSIIYTLGR